MFNILSYNGKGTHNCAAGRFYTGRLLCTGVSSVLSSSDDLSVLLLTGPNLSGNSFASA
jgi:hypothetical protein